MNLEAAVNEQKPPPATAQVEEKPAPTSAQVKTPPDAATSEVLRDWLSDYPPPRSLSLDQEAVRIYEHAYAIGLEVERPADPPITFTTVLAALLCGEDDTSVWFAQLASEHGPRPDAVFNEKGVDQAQLRRLVPPPGKPHSVRLASDKHLLTVSAREVIGGAEGWALGVGGSDIGVRHLVASYILNPLVAHGEQMRRWQYRETAWRDLFARRMRERYTAERWADSLRRPAPSMPQEFERLPVKGADLDFPGLLDDSAREIIQRAAEHHARRKDRWLRWQTVFHSMMQTALAKPAIGSAIEPLVKGASSQYERAYNRYFSAPPSGELTSFEGLDISPRVLNALETARELAVATQKTKGQESRVNVLHLAGALVSRRVDGDAELGVMGFNPQELRLALIRHAEAKGHPVEVWREALGEEESLQAGRPLVLNSDEPEAIVRVDEPWASDPLAIRRDVETFAALLASEGLQPPLSIGLFGPWGSGKTTFLKRLRRAVDRRAEEAKKAVAEKRPTPYVSNVVHVDFNAWHFAEGALTSSLVDTIFRALSRYIKDEQPIAGKAWRQQKLEALETTQRRVAAAAALEQAASAAASQAEAILEKSRREAAAAATSMQAVVQVAWSATKDALKDSSTVKDSRVLETLGDTVRSVEDLRTRLETLRNRPARMLADLGWRRSLVFAALVLIVPPVAGWLAGSVLNTDQSVQLLSTVTATLSVIGVWVRAAAAAVSKVDKAVSEVADAYAKRLSEDANVVKAQADLDAAQAKAATAATVLKAAGEELGRARTEVASATLPAQMLQLVSGRTDAESYSSELTTLSLARADLEALSLILRDQASERTSSSRQGGPAEKEGPPSAPARAVDRVILYIDDLDRCKPADVVRVLQLVHMLLAFELFVVVVAVDARWVEEALMRGYPWLGGGATEPADGGSVLTQAQPARVTPRVTPQDYLEKIFQVAFWLEPMTASRAASYLGSLVRAPARDFGPNLPADIAHSISGIELDYMRALTAYIGSSPRRAKRLVNVYRLIKAGMSDGQLGSFLADRQADDGRLTSGPYQLVIGLLVIGTGAPSSSAEILKELSECNPGATLDQLVEQFRAREHPDWKMSAQVLETLMRTQKTKNAAELRGWARKVGRFLLHAPGATAIAEVRAAPAAQPKREQMH